MLYLAEFQKEYFNLSEKRIRRKDNVKCRKKNKTTESNIIKRKKHKREQTEEK